jgi:hypothetical protein
MVVKRNDAGLIEVYGSGRIRYRPPKFTRALGRVAAAEYQRGLKELAPEVARMEYPSLSAADAERAAPELYELVRKALEHAQ